MLTEKDLDLAVMEADSIVKDCYIRSILEQCRLEDPVYPEQTLKYQEPQIEKETFRERITDKLGGILRFGKAVFLGAYVGAYIGTEAFAIGVALNLVHSNPVHTPTEMLLQFVLSGVQMGAISLYPLFSRIRS